MSEHYPESAIGSSVLHFCSQCKRLTDHLVVKHSEHAGRLGHCVDPQHPKPGGEDGLSVKQRKRREKQEKERQNLRLF